MGSGFQGRKPATLPVGVSFPCLPWPGTSSPHWPSSEQWQWDGRTPKAWRCRDPPRGMWTSPVGGSPACSLVFWFLSRSSGAGSRRRLLDFCLLGDLGNYDLSPGIFVRRVTEKPWSAASLQSFHYYGFLCLPLSLPPSLSISLPPSFPFLFLSFLPYKSLQWKKYIRT